MNTITIKKLELFNFKGIRNLVIDFKKITDISGKNETGKTTIFDAFTWGLFGKDSSDKSQFDIKTLDENNVVIPKIEHSVTVTLDVNGTEVILKRVYKEKWVKKRGSLETEFSGHETLYYWNDVPMLANEYSAKISELIDEGIFKLITNPLYFNSIPWKDRRDVLIRIAGDVSDDEIAVGNDEFLKLITGLGEKTIELYKRELASKRKMLNDDLKLIPTRIDEATRSMPEVQDFAVVKHNLEVAQEEIAKIDGAISNKSKALGLAQEEHTKKQATIFDVKRKIETIKFEAGRTLDDQERNKNSKLVKIESDRGSVKLEWEQSNRTLINLNVSKRELTEVMDTLREEWEMKNGEHFILDINQTKCPTCERELNESDTIKDTLEQNFNNSKTEKLTDINKKGASLKSDAEKTDQQISEKTKEFDGLTQKLDNLLDEINAEKKLVENYQKPELEVYLKDQIEYQKLVKELATLEAEIGDAPTVDTTELLSQKAPIQTKIDDLKLLLNDETIILNVKKRIKELEDQERNLAQQISDLEKSEFTIENFEKEKAYKLESKINAKFKYAKFKLFEKQINGGQIPCCETIYKGVPYSSLNNAATINIGIDIINTLCKFHDVSAPIFTDNAEAVNELMPTESQMIRLIVTTDKELKIY